MWFVGYFFRHILIALFWFFLSHVLCAYHSFQNFRWINLRKWIFSKMRTLIICESLVLEMPSSNISCSLVLPHRTPVILGAFHCLVWYPTLAGSSVLLLTDLLPWFVIHICFLRKNKWGIIDTLYVWETSFFNVIPFTHLWNTDGALILCQALIRLQILTS